MKYDLFEKRSEGVIALEFVTVPTVLSNDLPASHAEWLREQVTVGSRATMDVDDYAAMHPAYGRIVGFGFAALRHVDGGVNVEHYAMDTCDEVGALELADELIREYSGTTVSYARGGYLERMLLARMRLAGFRTPRQAVAFSRRHVDVSALLSLKGLFAAPPLPLAMDMLGIRSDRHRSSVQELWHAYDRGDDEALDLELRHRLDDLARFYSRVGVSPRAEVTGSVVEGRIVRDTVPASARRVAA